MPLKKKDALLTIFVVIGFFLVLYFALNLTAALDVDDNIYISFIDALEQTVLFQGNPIQIIELCGAKVWETLLICVLIYGVAVTWAIVELQRKAHFKDEITHGSAKWMADMNKYNKTYSDPPGKKENNGSNNMIMTDDVMLNMDTRTTLLNNNITVVGGSGSGKSRFFVKPNILQANCNYVITDPSGELLESTGHFLENKGYTIKVFNLVEMAKSNCYNPFDYIRDDLGVVMMIKCLIKNTTPPGQKGGDPFWEKSEEALLQAISFYLIEARPKKDRNFSTVMKLLRCAEVNEQDPSAESELDKLFKQHEKENPNSLAVKQYKIFKMGAGKTLKSILISCSVRLTVFNLEQIAALTRSDDNNGVELEKMGDGKRALFVIIPSADSTYNFLVSMMYSQLFETLYFIAETQRANKKLESPVRFLLDEFANIGEIPEFNKKLATMRKYDISCSIILQNLAQIKTMYKDDWPTILGNCDSFLFLGGQEYETVEYISKELGDATITVRNRNNSIGKSKSTSQGYSQTKRPLMTPNELMKLKNNECILLIRGLDPFRSRKYQYTKHKNYKYTGDADKKKKYQLKIMNQTGMTQEEIVAMREKFFAKAASAQNKKSTLIGDAKPLEDAVRDANLKNMDSVSVIAPSLINEANKSEIKGASVVKVSPVANLHTDNINDVNNERSQEPANIDLNDSMATRDNIINDIEKGFPINLVKDEKKKNVEDDTNAGIAKEDGNFIATTREEEELDEWEV